jgi:hypothetical protein
MAHPIPFDTPAHVKKLRAAGFSEAQAEAQAEAFAELINEQLATKRDLAELEARLSARIKELDVRRSAQIKELDSRLSAQTKEFELRLDSRLKVFELRPKKQELRLVVKLSAVLVAVLAAFAALEKFF